MKKILLLFFGSSLFFPSTINAQDYKRTFNWYFGDSIAISFSTNPPSLLSKGGLSNAEGSSAVISDTNGNLLFYTDGQTVWNRNHTAMQNGTMLNGSWDATQPAIIVPHPGNDSLYYVFTVDRLGLSKGLQYSIVNMNRNNSFGALTTKNVMLQTPVCEKIAATRHQNGKDIWVLAHGFGNSQFYAYLITNEGVVSCPVITSIGATHGSVGVSAQGQMKFTNDGKKLAATVFDVNNSGIDIFDFDNCTGTLSNNIFITNVYLPFGLEFSSNTKHLYVTTRGNELLTYNLSDYNSASIESSKTILVDYPNLGWIPVSLQLSANKKIYLTYTDSFHLGVIHYPDSNPSNSQYDEFSTNTGTKRTKGGLPNFISSYFHNNEFLSLYYTLSCQTSIGTFEGKAISTPSSWNWRIKRLSNGTTTNYYTQSFVHSFPDSGWYEARLIANNDTVIKTFFVEAPLLPATDTLGCGVDSVVLTVPQSYRCLQWSDTSVSLYSRIIKTNGVYRVDGYNSQGCHITDSIELKFVPSNTQPTITKNGDTLQSSPSFVYKWFLNDTIISGENGQKYIPAKAGIYKVLVTDSNGCSNKSNPFSSNLGIAPVMKKNISIYPNPARETLFIESIEATIYEVKIYDMTGRIVYEQSALSGSSLQINCSEFIRGIYFIKINSDLNTYYSYKIIIQ